MGPRRVSSVTAAHSDSRITAWVGIVWSTENSLMKTEEPLGSPRVAAFSRGLLAFPASREGTPTKSTLNYEVVLYGGGTLGHGPPRSTGAVAPPTGRGLRVLGPES